MELQARRWQRTEDAGLTVFLAIMMIYVPLLLAGGSTSETDPVVSVFMTLLLLSAAMTAVRHPVVRIMTLALLATAICSHWTAVFFTGLTVDTVRMASAILLLMVIIGALARKTFRIGKVTAHRIRGAIAVYLLVGLLWAFAYSLVDAYVPGSFSQSRAVYGSRFQELVYFSFVTLTTVGYGDMSPLTPAARSLAILEAILGQMYLAVVLARLVSLELSQSSEPGEEQRFRAAVQEGLDDVEAGRWIADENLDAELEAEKT